MKKCEILDNVCEIVKRYSQFDCNNIIPDMDLRENYGVDSIVLVEMLVDIECDFDITFDSSHLTYDNFSTVNAIVQYIEKQMAEGA